MASVPLSWLPPGPAAWTAAPPPQTVPAVPPPMPPPGAPAIASAPPFVLLPMASQRPPPPEPPLYLQYVVGDTVVLVPLAQAQHAQMAPQHAFTPVMRSVSSSSSGSFGLLPHPQLGTQGQTVPRGSDLLSLPSPLLPPRELSPSGCLLSQMGLAPPLQLPLPVTRSPSSPRIIPIALPGGAPPPPSRADSPDRPAADADGNSEDAGSDDDDFDAGTWIHDLSDGGGPLLSAQSTLAAGSRDPTLLPLPADDPPPDPDDAYSTPTSPRPAPGRPPLSFEAYVPGAPARKPRRTRTPKLGRAKRFPCEVCGAKFFSSGHLSRHRYTHRPDDLKPHGCPIPGCLRRFSRSDNARIHHKAHLRQIQAEAEAEAEGD
ncbi:hypothetical protein DFJ74DRAFT_766046 [Hyaloraphidium curvatum]|nr:hypothetical protein DFJ74DRAFT_766046 [Hyaloraphidium curvatum]